MGCQRRELLRYSLGRKHQQQSKDTYSFHFQLQGTCGRNAGLSFPKKMGGARAAWPGRCQEALTWPALPEQRPLRPFPPVACDSLDFCLDYSLAAFKFNDFKGQKAREKKTE